MDPHLARAQVLLEQGRFDMAAEELRLSLGTDPENPVAHALLALCASEGGRFDEAEGEAKAAIGAAPDQPLGHYALGVVLLKRRRYDEAERAAEEALQIDPENASYFALLGHARMEQRRWTVALEAAEGGLQVDPEDVPCANLRAAALIKLGRRAEAAETIGGALARDPENASTHAMHGWALLHEGKPREALGHFREALRLEPDNEWSKAGMVEALKARNPLYGIMLRWFLFMSRLSGRAQWIIVIGGYIGYRALSDWAGRDPRAAPWLQPLIWGYIAFAIMTWVAAPLFNLVLRLHPYGKYALSDDQRKGANLVGACVFTALAGLGGYLLGHPFLGLVALAAALLLPPVSSIYVCSEGWPRWLMAGYSLALVGLLAAIASILLFWTGPEERATSLITTLAGVFAAGAFLSQFAANALHNVEPTR